MATPLFWFKGKNTNNQRVEGLTWDQVMELDKQEREMIAKEQSIQADAEANMKAGPALNQEISGYLKDNPTARPMQAIQSGAIKNDTIPTQEQVPQSSASQFALGSDSFNKNLSDFASKLQNESSLSGIPATDQGTGMQQQAKPSVDTETAYNGMLKGIPVEIAHDLIFQYHNGLIKPKDFLKEVAAVKKSLYDISVEENKANQASARRIKEEGMKSQGEIDKQYVVGENQIDLANVNNEAELQRLREENASKERIAATKSSEKTSKEDRALIQIDKTLRNDFLVKQRSEQLQYASNTLALLNSGNPVSNQAAKTQLARLSGEVGVLTDRDVERFGGSKALLAKMNQKVTEMTTGKLSKENQAFLVDVATAFYTAAQRSLNDRLNVLAEGQADAFEVPIDRIRPLINAYSAKPAADQNTNTTQVQKPAPATGNVVSIKTEDEYNKLQSGTPYIGPDGKKRVKR